jgi:hypothetical protein
MRNAAPGYTYAMKYYPLPLEIVTASKTGSASWQFHITADQISGMYWNLCVYSHTAYGGTNLTLLFFAVNWIYYYQP